LVRHRRLILPQLGATGVSAHQVKKQSGFEVVWGPVRARDIKPFLDSDLKGDAAMRRITFTPSERLVLVPVEITLLRKYLGWSVALIFALSAIGPHFLSLSAIWQRGLLAAMAVLTGIVAGCAAVPALLPQLPGRAFAVKGGLAGAVAGALIVAVQWSNPWITVWSALALVLLTTSVSSFLSMNFTGSTPYTSPSGVEKEMRRAIPMQLAAALIAVVIWVCAAFG
ncbi:MAG: hypothetical protein HKP58_10255, partial [Desulfatitalea sp.]|nr:hypothetical protein [Desulfatitalea sp.]NNK00783.1 hypothetical protein [Desulfatitalea sp.]